MSSSIADPPSEIQKARRVLTDACPFGLAPHLAELRPLGIPVDAILRNENLCEIYLATLAGGLVCGRCLIVPCLDEFEEVVDFVAVPIDGSAAVPLFGLTPILGLDRLVRPQHPGRVTVHPNPMDWLRSGADGCCILDWGKAAPILCSQPVTFLAGSGAVTRMLRESGVQTKILTQRNRREHAA